MKKIISIICTALCTAICFGQSNEMSSDEISHSILTKYLTEIQASNHIVNVDYYDTDKLTDADKSILYSTLYDKDLFAMKKDKIVFKGIMISFTLIVPTIVSICNIL